MRSTQRGRARRPSGGEHVFADDSGRLWTAARAVYGSGPYGDGEGAVVFHCISDSREAVRAIESDPGRRLADLGDDGLRALLHDAPPIGRLI